MREETMAFSIGEIRMEDDIAIMEFDNGNRNKLMKPEFILLEDLDGWLKENQPKGLIICGKKRNFSAGADLQVLKGKKREEFLKELRKGKELLTYIENLPIVTVAAVQGICSGGGFEIALSCQFRVAAENAVFSFPESTLGLLPGMSGTIRLKKLIGSAKAIEMILSGNPYLAKEALSMGIVDLVCEKGECLTTAKKFIHDLCEEKTVGQINSIISSVHLGEEEYESEQFINLAFK